MKQDLTQQSVFTINKENIDYLIGRTPRYEEDKKKNRVMKTMHFRDGKLGQRELKLLKEIWW